MSTEAQLKKFKKIDEDWRNDMMSRDSEDLNKVIRDCAINNVVLALAKAADPDLARIAEELATAKAVYTDGTKANNLKIEFLVEVLRSQGVDIPDVSAFCKALAKDDSAVPSVKEAVARFKKAIPDGTKVTMRVVGRKGVVDNRAAEQAQGGAVVTNIGEVLRRAEQAADESHARVTELTKGDDDTLDVDFNDLSSS